MTKELASVRPGGRGLIVGWRYDKTAFHVRGKVYEQYINPEVIPVSITERPGWENSLCPWLVVAIKMLLSDGEGVDGVWLDNDYTGEEVGTRDHPMSDEYSANKLAQERNQDVLFLNDLSAIKKMCDMMTDEEIMHDIRICELAASAIDPATMDVTMAEHSWVEKALSSWPKALAEVQRLKKDLRKVSRERDEYASNPIFED